MDFGLDSFIHNQSIENNLERLGSGAVADALEVSSDGFDSLWLNDVALEQPNDVGLIWVVCVAAFAVD